MKIAYKHILNNLKSNPDIYEISENSYYINIDGTRKFTTKNNN